MAYSRPIPEHSAGWVLMKDKNGSVIWPHGEWTIYENTLYGWQHHVVYTECPRRHRQVVTAQWFYLMLVNGETRRFRKWGHLLAFANDPKNAQIFS
jgi:hypothetical protein